MRKNIKYSFGEYVRDVWHYILPYKGTFFFAVFLRFTSDIAHLYPVWALSQVVLILSKFSSVDTAVRDLTPIFVLWGLTTLYYGITHNLARYFGFMVAEKASLDIYKDTLAHVFKLDLSWQEKENSGNKMKRIDRGLDGVNRTIKGSLT